MREPRSSNSSVDVVVIVSEARFFRTPDQRIWGDPAYANGFFSRYLECFCRVKLVVRIGEVDSPPAGKVQAGCENIDFYPIPYYVGPRGFVLNLLRLYVQLSKLCADDYSFILRVPGVIGPICAFLLKRRRYPYAVEVIGGNDAPDKQFSVWRLYHSLFRGLTRSTCANASAASYVTESTLQGYFPATKAIFQTFYSSLSMPSDCFLETKKNSTVQFNNKLIFVGSLEVPYKGLSVLLEALALCHRRGVPLQLRVVGSGRLLEHMQDYAEVLGLGKHVIFSGFINVREELNQLLDEADLFILPSLTEGLPRALIEAMARGLPCVATRVGGVPELLEDASLVPPNDAYSLSTRIVELSQSHSLRESSSKKNLAVAKRFYPGLLQRKRTKFYNIVKNLSKNA